MGLSHNFRGESTIIPYYILYVYVYIYIIMRKAWALPRHCSVEGPHSQQMLLQLCIPLGRSTKVLGNIKIPPLLNSTFNWEDQQRY